MLKQIKNGVYPTMVTPYTPDNKIDFNAVEKILNYYSDCDCDGVFAICQSSEIFFLSFEERLELLKFIVDHLPKGMNIVASGHTADDIDRQIYEANAFIDCGIDAYVFIANRFAKENEGKDVFLKNYYKMVSSIPEISLGVYECPHPYKRLMTPDVLAECAKDGRMQFLKDTCGRIGDIKAKLDSVKDYNLKIFNANAATLLESLRLGCAGYSGVMANFHPEIYSWLCKNFDKQPEIADKVGAFLGFASLAECQCYPVNAKYHMALRGLGTGIFSRARDCKAFSESNRKEINEMLLVEDEIKKLYNI
ncbi:MAG: dihydrodipicolinate synthase family protein [Clostridiales bacterium]|nr:dihydrodipicolinate synthase family protein [Clostridiales bacterium]